MSIQYPKAFKITVLAFAISLSSLPSQGMAHGWGHHSSPGFYINWHHYIKPYRKYKRHHHHKKDHHHIHRHHPRHITHSHEGYKKKYRKKYKKNKIIRKHLRRD